VRLAEATLILHYTCKQILQTVVQPDVSPVKVCAVKMLTRMDLVDGKEMTNPDSECRTQQAQPFQWHNVTSATDDKALAKQVAVEGIYKAWPA